MYIQTVRLLNCAMKKYIHSFILFFIFVLIAGCAGNSSKTINIENMETLAGLQAMSATKGSLAAATGSSGKIRIMALRETALSIGAQSALAYRAKCIDEKLIKEARRLDTIYDFNSLILKHNILPPVLLEGRNILNLADSYTIRVADRVYKIAKQSRFVTTPPNWRQYLWMDYKKPDYPHVTLLPKTKEERELWAQCVEQAWKDGIEQANTIFEENVARITQDFIGMIRYRKLLAMNMISPPFVSHTELGVTGDSEKIYIDDRVLRITALPALNVNSKEWKAAVQKEENLLEKLNHMEKAIKTAKINITSKAWQPVVDTDKSTFKVEQSRV